MNLARQSTGHFLPWMTLTLAGLMAALFAALGPAPDTWVYDRVAISDGEWWRLLTGHLAHSDTSHLYWNLSAFLLLGWIVETRNRLTLLIGLVSATIAVDAMLWIALPGLFQYCGMSGVLNTLLLFALATLWRRSTALMLAMIGATSFAKIVWELQAGQALVTETAWGSVPLAHLAGWLIGMTLICYTWLTRSNT